jgi:transposase
VKVAGSIKKQLERALEIIAMQSAVIEQLTAENEHLKARISELERQLGQNSNNSSKPPSSDGFKKKPKSLRPTGGKTGGQPGHKGHKLKMTDTPDEVIVHSVCKCEHCHASLVDERVLDYEHRQVFDLPRIRLWATEHQAEIKECPRCERQSRAAFPENVKVQAQYGLSVKGLLTYWNVGQFISFERCAEMFYDLTGHTISEGTVALALALTAHSVAPYERQIREGLLVSPVNNADESGVRVGKKLQWLHVVSNGKLTYYHPHPKRGREAIDAAGLLPQYKGVLVTDFWKSYLNLDSEHAFCCAHLLRECQGIIDNHGGVWAADMQALLREAWHLTKQRREKGESLSPEELSGINERYKATIAAGFEQLDALLKPSVKTVAKNLLLRFDKYHNEILRFTTNSLVPFDNNQAERDIRMVKTKTKVSGAFRTDNGVKQFASIRGFISTVRKQGCRILDAISQALSGEFQFPCAE